ncbi:MAG: YicC/YloC family endoribonuclease [Candidatus Firestonebacteria bacterium]
MKSMTGFGNGFFNLKGVRYTVEIKSVNHKYFDANFKMPDSLIHYQDKVKGVIRNKITRGYLDVVIFVDCNSGNKKILVDIEFAKNYLNELKKLQKTLGIKGNISLEMILRFSEIFKVQDVRKINWLGLKNALLKAMDNILNSKRKEGGRIGKDISRRVDKLKIMLNDIVRIHKKSIPEIKRKLKEKFIKNFNEVKINEDRLYAEISGIIEKSDITEEIVRLNCHLKEFCDIIRNNEIVGRRLDFLIQEIMREINTLGAKCISVDISHNVVSFKEELEKIREQMQNVE